jgi:hypothetical protein
MFPTKFKTHNFQKYITKAPEVTRSAGVPFITVHHDTAAHLTLYAGIKSPRTKLPAENFYWGF